ncbi:VOC family protein [Lampropedia puyangensis]|uniref:VOC family protein n=1 Tax=Lampropedia puyangensis TaxID=1330072 RepID=A0A4S8F1P9_9BURK|nr:VOC family protein [Lampropedia puyangensis]THU00255.1 VOC family protein [Lampropedia puyangensis]
MTVQEEKVTPCVVLDHIAVAAPSLEQGVQWVESVLGVRPQPGGQHPRMGTHNALLRLGPSLYLEVIAPQAGVPAPAQPRWFALDTLPSDAPPRLAMWVLRTNAIAQTIGAASEPLGPVQAMSRGERRWQITIPADGSIPVDGVGPAVIEWEAGLPHPAEGLSDQGLSLQRLRIAHPQPQRLAHLAQSLGLQQDSAMPVLTWEACAHQQPFLTAEIMTAQGLRVMRCAVGSGH